MGLENILIRGLVKENVSTCNYKEKMLNGAICHINAHSVSLGGNVYLMTVVKEAGQKIQSESTAPFGVVKSAKTASSNSVHLEFLKIAQGHLFVSLMFYWWCQVYIADVHAALIMCLCVCI